MIAEPTGSHERSPALDADPRNDFAQDHAVARRALAGDESARREFIERMKCVPRMLAARNASLRFPLSQDELEELTQDTLVTLWRRLGSYRGQATLETWACAFCHRSLLHVMKSRLRRRDGTSEIHDVATVDELPEIDRYDRLYQALDQLDDDDARILRFKHFDQLTFDQIAARMRRASSTIKSCYYQAIEQLRSRLRPRDVDGGLS